MLLRKEFTEHGGGRKIAAILLPAHPARIYDKMVGKENEIKEGRKHESILQRT